MENTTRRGLWAHAVMGIFCPLPGSFDLVLAMVAPSAPTVVFQLVDVQNFPALGAGIATSFTLAVHRQRCAPCRSGCKSLCGMEKAMKTAIIGPCLDRQNLPRAGQFSPRGGAR
jgi:hypothetical protein